MQKLIIFLLPSRVSRDSKAKTVPQTTTEPESEAISLRGMGLVFIIGP